MQIAKSLPKSEHRSKIGGNKPLIPPLCVLKESSAVAPALCEMTKQPEACTAFCCVFLPAARSVRVCRCAVFVWSFLSAVSRPLPPDSFYQAENRRQNLTGQSTVERMRMVGGGALGSSVVLPGWGGWREVRCRVVFWDLPGRKSLCVPRRLIGHSATHWTALVASVMSLMVNTTLSSSLVRRHSQQLS